MCVVSAVGDNWNQRLPEKFPWVNKSNPSVALFPVSRQEFEALQKEVKALRELLLAAKKFDEETNQPNCEVDEKVKLIKQIAKMVGVDMKDVFEE